MSDERPEDDAAPGEPSVSARERRRQRFEAENKGLKRVKAPSIKPGKILVPLIVLLIIAGIAFAIVHREATSGDCPGHWHSTMKVYVDGDEVDFSRYNLEARGTPGELPVAYHMHQGDTQWKWHFEPQTGMECLGFRTPSKAVDMDIRPDRITFDGLHEGRPWAGTHEANATHTVHAYHRVGGGSWSELPIDELNDRQLRDGERLLVLFGDYSDEEVASLQQTVPSPTGGPDVQHPA